MVRTVTTREDAMTGDRVQLEWSSVSIESLGPVWLRQGERLQLTGYLLSHHEKTGFNKDHILILISLPLLRHLSHAFGAELCHSFRVLFLDGLISSLS